MTDIRTGWNVFGAGEMQSVCRREGYRDHVITLKRILQSCVVFFGLGSAGWRGFVSKVVKPSDFLNGGKFLGQMSGY